jgi:predicted nucleotidyltransferase
MPNTPDNLAEAAAREFARAVSARWQETLGDGLLGVYLIGSLAHGGFNRRYSDIDMALIVAEPLAPATLDALRAEAAKVSADLAAKLSIFWTDRSFAVGRFPILDRIDYLDHAVALIERERVRPSRPALAEVRAYLSGAPFERWCADAKQFAASATLEPQQRKAFLRTLLYPARLIYSGTTGRIGSNDDAVAFLAGGAPPGLDVAPIAQALECRRAASDPDRLFPSRAALPRQAAACERLIADWAAG